MSGPFPTDRKERRALGFDALTDAALSLRDACLHLIDEQDLDSERRALVAEMTRIAHRLDQIRLELGDRA